MTFTCDFSVWRSGESPRKQGEGSFVIFPTTRGSAIRPSWSCVNAFSPLSTVSGLTTCTATERFPEYAPDGRTSETIFAVPGFSVGIQQGVVISLWVKNGKHAGHADALYRDDLNAARAVERRARLLESLQAKDFEAQYKLAVRTKAIGTPSGLHKCHLLTFRGQVLICSRKCSPRLEYWRIAGTR